MSWLSRRRPCAPNERGCRGGTCTVLLFLHADCKLPDNADELILKGIVTSGVEWGRFDVRIEGSSRWLPVVASFMNLRSRITGIATGDHAMFVTSPRVRCGWRIP
jgi:hypothetical protein